MKESGDNRRRFFRIIDALGVSYRVMSGKESTANSDEDEGAVQFVDTLSVMNDYNTLIQSSLEKIKTKDEHAAIAIEQLNKKVDTILMMLELDSLITQRACHRVEEASISASGIAFPIEESLQSNTYLALDLLLRPSSKHVNAVGKVIACDRLSAESLYYLRVEFTEMMDKDREILIQHIVQRQGTLLRALKSDEYKD
ncbi:MAG: hypothetical protein ACI9NY_001171 [Kiritimatiellia bacterium]|jgi:hypothetical protein